MDVVAAAPEVVAAAAAAHLERLGALHTTRERSTGAGVPETA
jgi:hypothetical protein